jgi:glyoxylase-like metal-dependent hydrolase (beta-lactamase superfamily II)
MEIIPNLHRIPGVKGVNVYLLLGSTLTLVDTGMPGNANAILGYIDSLGLAPAGLARIVLTHHHLDHVGSAAALKQRTAAQLLAHPADVPFIARECAPPPPRNALDRLLGRLVPILIRAEPAPVDLTVQDGDRLDLLGGATVVHVPGHSPGSIALHLPSERVLICGDAIDHRRNRLEPPSKLFTADMDQALASLRRLAELEFDLLCPGHGDPIVGGAGEQVRAMVRGWA